MKSFGRKWRVTISSDNGSQWVIPDKPEDGLKLHCVFRVEKFMLTQAFWAEVSMYNLNMPTQTRLIEEGDFVVIEAGYEEGPYEQLFSGSVFQPMFERENVTDYKTTLYCMDGLGLLTANISNVTLQSGYDYRSVISAMAASAHKAIPLGSITSNLDSKSSPRGKTIFGEPNKYIRQLEQDNNAIGFVSDGKLNIAKIDDECSQEALVITPTTGLVGTPQQTQYGVNFRCLLNPSITITSPPMVVKLDQTVVRQMKARPGQYLTPLDKDGFYKVIGVVYTGDTRGNSWYVDVSGVNLAGKVSALFPHYSR